MAKYNVTWIEEPTNPDDIMGHLAISKVSVCCVHDLLLVLVDVSGLWSAKFIVISHGALALDFFFG